MKLHDFQQRAVDNTLIHIQKNLKTLLVSPCGSGKTFMIAAIALWAAARGMRTLILAHRREIIEQTRRCLLGAGFDTSAVNVILAKHALDGAAPNALVQVASKDTMVRRALPMVDLLIVDECHHVLARVYQQLVDSYGNIPQVGFTATPMRLDGRGLGSYYDVFLEAAKPSELIARGHLAEPRVFTTSEAFLPDLVGVPSRSGDYVLSKLAERVLPDHLIGDVVRHRNEVAAGRTTVVFCVDLAHSRAIRDRFLASGISAEHVDNKLSSDDRAAVLRRVSSGQTQVLCNCMVLSEGWDLPACQVVVLARPTHSLALYLQQAGRGLRVYGDKRPIILDHAGSVPKFHMPHADRRFILSDQKLLGVLGAPPVKTCPTCFAVVPAGFKACPECGFEFPYKEVLHGPQPTETTEQLLEVELDKIRERVLGFALAKGIQDPATWADRVVAHHGQLLVEV